MEDKTMVIVSRELYVRRMKEMGNLFRLMDRLCSVVRTLPQNRGSKLLSDMSEASFRYVVDLLPKELAPAVYFLFGEGRMFEDMLSKEIEEISDDEEDDDEDEVFEDEEDYDEDEDDDEDDDEPTLEEIIAMTLSDLADAVQEMNVYLHTITQHMKK